MANCQDVLDDRPAGNIDSRDRKVSEQCKHCKKSTKNWIECGKCNENFHSACLIQSATQKSTTCRHVPGYAVDDFWEHEKDLYNKIILILEEKNALLMENNRLLADANRKFQEKEENVRKTNCEVRKSQEVNKIFPPIRQNKPRPTSIPSCGNAGQSVSGADEDVTKRKKSSANQNHEQKDVIVSVVTPVNVTPVSSVSSVDVSSVDVSRGAEQHKQNQQVINVNENNEKWTIVSSKRSRLKRENRPEPLKGSNSDTAISLAVAQKQGAIFVTGLVPNTGTEEIMGYLKSNNLGEGVNCEKMITKTDRYKSSFKLTLPNAKKREVMNPELWPNGVTINHFLNLQRHSLNQPSRDVVPQRST